MDRGFECRLALPSSRGADMLGDAGHALRIAVAIPSIRMPRDQFSARASRWRKGSFPGCGSDCGGKTGWNPPGGRQSWAADDEIDTPFGSSSDFRAAVRPEGEQRGNTRSRYSVAR